MGVLSTEVSFSFKELKQGRALVIPCANEKEARTRAIHQTSHWSEWAYRLGCRSTRLTYPSKDGLKHYCILAAMPEEEEVNQKERNSLGMNSNEESLLGADYMRILEFLLQQRKDGKIVIITDHETSVCLHTNDLLTPARGLRQAWQWEGYGYLRSWRRDRNTEFTNPHLLEVNPEFDDLCSRLESEGAVRGFDYSLYRPDPGGDFALDDKVRYQTDYFLCRNYKGRTVRIGVSNPADYQVVEMAGK